MSKTGDEQKTCSRISDFYEGKSLFVTGASGYLGTILLEILLRCLPGIKNIYILLRPKKGVDPISRKSLLFQKLIFSELLQQNPEIVDKVHVIPGDVSQPNLGMSDEDTSTVVKNVTVVFHLAAVVSFFKPLRFTAIQNCLGTKHVIELCRKLRELEVLVYTSTAYSNSNRFPYIEEICYRLPMRAERYIDSLENGKMGEFEKLASMCKPEWPNNYTFSKCLAENIINDMASDLPVAIVRPSMIFVTWKGIRPGYIEEGTGIIDLSIAVGKGFARVMEADTSTRIDLIPVDIVANVHIVTAWSVATNRLPSPLIINCTAGHAWDVKLVNFFKDMLTMRKTHLLPKTFQEPSIKLVKNKYLCALYIFYEHHIPAFVLDVILSLQGSKLKLMKMYIFFEKVMKQLSFFMTRTFDFAVDNLNSLPEHLDPRDKEIFYMDLSEANFKEMVFNIPKSCAFYDWTIDKKSPEKRRQAVLVRTRMINFIRWFFLVLLCWGIYIIFFKVL